MEKENKEVENSGKPSTETKLWAGVGKVTVILGIIVSSIAIWSYFFAKQPDLYAFFYQSERLLPDTVSEQLKKESESDIYLEFIDKLPKKETEFFADTTIPAINLLKSLSAEKVLKRKLVLFELKRIHQKIEIVIANEGSKEAESVKIEVSKAVTGFYNLDFSSKEAQSFEKTIDIGNIRPDSIVYIDIWVNDVTINSKDIKITYPEGVVEVIDRLDKKQSWLEVSAIPLLAIENLIFLVIILVVVYQVAKAEKSEDKDKKLSDGNDEETK